MQDVEKKNSWTCMMDSKPRWATLQYVGDTLDWKSPAFEAWYYPWGKMKTLIRHITIVIAKGTPPVSYSCSYQRERKKIPR